MISPNELKNGIVIKFNGLLYSVVQFQHIKPGKGGAFVRTKLKNVKDGSVIDRTFRETELLEEVFIEEEHLQFLYKDGGIYHFMDNETFEQFALDEKVIGEGVKFLKENLEVSVYTHEGSVLSLCLPPSVNLKVVHTEPGIKGDTAKGATKPAELETGIKISVPLFINTGDVIIVNTRSGKYSGRA